MKSPKVAIVTTLIDADAIIESFVTYHLSIGFDHMFLFFDDPNDPSISKVINNKNVTVVRNDWALHIQWGKTKVFKKNKDRQAYISKEVMARQLLNVAVAVEYCKKQKIDWLLHIDCDELFYSPNQSVKEHFSNLSQKGISDMLYINYEALPEKADIINGFTEVTLFKKNRFHLNESQNKIKDSFSIRENPPSQRKVPIADFIAYEVGKSAGRVSNSLYSVDVFYYTLAPGSLKYIWNNTLFKTSMFFMNLFNRFKKVENPGNTENQIHRLYIDPSKVNKESFPIILHYPSCGFNAFVKKYETLGDFTDQWFENEHSDIQTFIPFHIEARNVIMRNGKNRVYAREFYEKTVVIRDPDLINSLIKRGILCRITKPAEQISSILEKKSTLVYN